MGVCISKEKLASAVSNAGGMGVIASVGLGDEFDSKNNNYVLKSAEALREIIRKTKQETQKPFAVNIMVALTNYESLCKVCAEENVSTIISGAGLPLRLPSYISNKKINLIPIVSSAKAARIIIKIWQKKYNRITDALIIEGPMAGGHLGFTQEELKKPKQLFDIIQEVKNLIKNEFPNFKIPVIAAGGIFSGKDIVSALHFGADGVQMATRFITTKECDANDEIKHLCLQAKENDIVIINSPVGLPGRVLRNKFVEKILSGAKITFKCPYKCLKTCRQDEANFCLAQALVNASKGNFDEGFVMPGANVYRLNTIVTVEELFRQLQVEACE